MAGIKDVAKRAKVGVGTVSRMINNSGYVAEETREKIERAMKELDYTPNELARNLFRKRHECIEINAFSCHSSLVCNFSGLYNKYDII